MKRYKSKFMESYIKDLWKSLRSLTNLFKKFNISYTIIGGAARNQYGYEKITEDIDVLVDYNDKDKLNKIPIGFMRKISDKKFNLHNPKTTVEILYDNEISGDGKKGLPFKHPNKISNIIKGVSFLSLEALIEYKLSSGIYGHARYKDFDDIHELIKRNNLSITYADNFRKDLKEKYLELWKEIYE